ncbi:MAG: hypothetical protein CO093_11795 [Alphaproteobacteria bacterium CG_4_9_14_3_um_filter_47_13]|nr:MAG: hypothetical protein CO093_11795 [Alphaproteobacteria bacterium CG_4_9_14_3_um_filter_47_13]
MKRKPETEEKSFLRQKFDDAVKKLDEMSPVKRGFYLAAIGAAAMMPVVLPINMAWMATPLVGALGLLIGGALDTKNFNSNMGSAVAGALFMGIALSPYMDVPEFGTKTQPSQNQTTISQPAVQPQSASITPEGYRGHRGFVPY